ncbi:MAG: hypothetical protein IPG44_00235 [Anaerolineales bacterium]|jgi:hypothetical protein|nr:hypothetical protein [Anaerolineales bacterium]
MDQPTSQNVQQWIGFIRNAKDDGEVPRSQPPSNGRTKRPRWTMRRGWMFC